MFPRTVCSVTGPAARTPTEHKQPTLSLYGWCSHGPSARTLDQPVKTINIHFSNPRAPLSNLGTRGPSDKSRDRLRKLLEKQLSQCTRGWMIRRTHKPSRRTLKRPAKILSPNLETPTSGSLPWTIHQHSGPSGKYSWISSCQTLTIGPNHPITCLDRC